MLKYKYRESSRVCSYLIKEHEKQIEQKVIEANSTGAFYKHVNRRLRYKAGVGPLIDDDGKLVTNDLYKSELLNKYFASVGVTDNGLCLVSFMILLAINLIVLFLLKQVCLKL